jgi:hypothetical protein
MQRASRIFIPLLLGVAIAAPASMGAGSLPAPRTPPATQERDRDHDRDNRRYEDREHHDYHNWNDREEFAYRHWLEERRERQYIAFERLQRARQAEYWRWRHEHLEYEGPHRVWDWNGHRWLDWDDRENVAYHRWLAERHENEIEYERLERARQQEYWRWRRAHRD